MTKLPWKLLKLSPVVLAATFFTANSALAGEVTENVTSVAQLEQQNESLGQVTSVSQFSDVQPTDWAFQALQSLVERYGCIAGYPNGTYRGNRAMTRYEFAAGLNACLDRVNELIATATADLVRKEDLATLQRLQEEFSAELATLRGRVDALEARTAELEANQFSTTTKLVGEAIFSLSDVFGDNAAIGARALRRDPNAAQSDLDSNITFSDRVRLSLNSSFFGSDLLQTRLQARNIVGNNTVSGTNMTRLGYDGNDENDVVLDKLNYSFNLGEAIRVKIDATGGEFYENINTFHPDLASSGRGSISRYGRFSPIYRQGQGGAGATVTINPQGALNVSLGYLAGGNSNRANSPLDRDGLFDGNYAAIAQIGFQPSKAFNLGFTYAHSYQNPARTVGGVTSGAGVNLFESTGSNIASQPFGNVPTTGNHYGIEATFRPTNRLTVSAWGGYTQAIAESSGVTTAGGVTTRVGFSDDAEAWYWGASLGIRDFGREGSLLGIIFGQPPKVTSNEARVDALGGGTRALRDTDTSYHLEGIYRLQLSNNISITPGVIVIFNPEHNDRNDTEYVGTLRTTFTF
ncbi:iron uptake porin [Scytonema sp. UIC 10036]|uniref:iron uptake porin n=1 Tax=Scytonema sp. UIC 10036 TaxID=2304196 RepID=UPI0012DA6602|nr:iron uptake porin [Scytonema sp. UIC 10036]MUG94922.1 iron uptake porin [Scytonema sp. UIC 10036]